MFSISIWCEQWEKYILLQQMNYDKLESEFNIIQ